MEIWLTAKDLINKYPNEFTIGIIEGHLHNREQNGLIKNGVIKRFGRFIFINESKWFDWLDSHRPYLWRKPSGHDELEF